MGIELATTICGIDELDAHAETPITHLVSILDPQTPRPGALDLFIGRPVLELRFDDVIEPAEGKILPAREHAAALLEFGAAIARAAGAGGAGSEARAHLLVHCFAGISRSTAAAAVLLAQAFPEVPGPALFAELHRLRPQAWPNLRLVELGDELLGRNGDLVRAASALHRRQLARRPELEAYFVEHGRAREIRLTRYFEPW